MRYTMLDDVQNVVVAFPRTGTTWLTALLGRYIQQAYNLPDEHTMQVEHMTRGAGLPVLAITHDPQRLDPEWDHTPDEEYAGKRVVLLLRDPRDALVSQYHTLRYRGSRGGMLGYEHGFGEDAPTLAEFARVALPRMLAFYHAWLGANATDFADFTLTTYEMLKASAVGELMRLACFFGYKENDAALAEAVRFASFDNMKALESTGALSSFYNVPDTEITPDPRGMRARRGEVGRFRQAMDEETVAWASREIASSLMADFYLSSVLDDIPEVRERMCCCE